MTTQAERADLLTVLHIKGDPLILYNIWDAGSAVALQEVGAKVIATGSWSVAAAHGFGDGEKLPFELALTNLRNIIRSVHLPVTIDLEGGYGSTPAEVQATVRQVLEAGAVGLNFEDQVVGDDGLYSISEQAARIAAIRETANQLSMPLFINARTDIFLKLDPATHNDAHLEQAVNRATTYAEAGASGFFAPGLINPDFIKELCQRSPLPVNILVMANTPPPRLLAELGVARISYGPGPYRQMIVALKAAARIVLSDNESLAML